MHICILYIPYHMFYKENKISNGVQIEKKAGKDIKAKLEGQCLSYFISRYYLLFSVQGLCETRW